MEDVESDTEKDVDVAVVSKFNEITPSKQILKKFFKKLKTTTPKPKAMPGLKTVDLYGNEVSIS